MRGNGDTHTHTHARETELLFCARETELGTSKDSGSGSWHPYTRLSTAVRVTSVACCSGSHRLHYTAHQETGRGRAESCQGRETTARCRVGWRQPGENGLLPTLRPPRAPAWMYYKNIHGLLAPHQEPTGSIIFCCIHLQPGHAQLLKSRNSVLNM